MLMALKSTSTPVITVFKKATPVCSEFSYFRCIVCTLDTDAPLCCTSWVRFQNTTGTTLFGSVLTTNPFFFFLQLWDYLTFLQWKLVNLLVLCYRRQIIACDDSWPEPNLKGHDKISLKHRAWIECSTGFHPKLVTLPNLDWHIFKNVEKKSYLAPWSCTSPLCQPPAEVVAHRWCQLPCRPPGHRTTGWAAPGGIGTSIQAYFLEAGVTKGGRGIYSNL